MIINLKQPEIVVAITDYIREQGINLVGKKVSLTFTAGRKDTGVSVEIDIEDPVTLSLGPRVFVPKLEAVEGIATAQSEPVECDENLVGEEPEPVAVPEPVEAVKTPSMFG